MAVTVADLKAFPGFENYSDVVLNFALDGAYCDNDSSCWGKHLDRAVTLQALAVALDMKPAQFGAGGPTTNMSRGMGANASMGFASPSKKAEGWERNVYGQQYVRLRQSVFAGGAMVVCTPPGKGVVPS